MYLSLKDSDSAHMGAPWNLCGIVLPMPPKDSDVQNIQESQPWSPYLACLPNLITHPQLLKIKQGNVPHALHGTD